MKDGYIAQKDDLFLIDGLGGVGKSNPCAAVIIIIAM